MISAFLDAPCDLRVEQHLDILFLIADEDSERLGCVCLDIDAGGGEYVIGDLELANAMHRECCDLCALAEAREKIQRRTVPHQLHRPRGMRSGRALPCRMIRELAEASPRN